VPVFVAAFLCSTALAVSPAKAQCSDRPGTPTHVAATAVNSRQISVGWTNTATEQVWWDVEITDGSGTVLSSPAGIGRGDRGKDLHITNLYDAPPLSKRCFRVKARTGPKTQGCVSQVWSNSACATTPATTAGERRLDSVPDRRAPGPVRQLGKRTQVATAIDDVDIYDGPGGEYTVIGMLRAGASADVAASQEGWRKLKIASVAGGSGWVAADHLKFSVKR
jgi:hypothetical protein